MTIRNPLLCIALVVCAVDGLGGQTAAAPSHQVGEQKELDALVKEVANLEARVNSLQGTVTFQGYLIEHKQDKQDSLELDPASRDFQRLDTDTGFFLVSLQSVTSYLNGYKVLLSIGNPSSADFANATVTVTWSKAYDYSHYSAESYQQWKKSRHTQTVQLTSTLEAGTWNPVEVDLLPAAADDLGDLSLAMQTKTVQMRQVPSN